MNKNGEVLEEVLSLAEYNLCVHNNEYPTYFQFKSSYTKILDIFISSTTLTKKITHFEVLTDHKMESDHAPIFCTLNFDKVFKISQRETKQRWNFRKANWNKFRENIYNIESGINSWEMNQNLEEIAIDGN